MLLVFRETVLLSWAFAPMLAKRENERRANGMALVNRIESLKFSKQ